MVTINSSGRERSDISGFDRLHFSRSAILCCGITRTAFILVGGCGSDPAVNYLLEDFCFSADTPRSVPAVAVSENVLRLLPYVLDHVRGQFCHFGRF